MRNLAALSALLALLAGCATTSQGESASYGYYAHGVAAAHDKGMADDVAKKLVAQYPPARTRFDLRHGTADQFGMSLVGTLRAKGYALAEFKQGLPPAASAGGADDRTRAGPGLAFAYLVDQPMDAGFYRVTLIIDGHTLSRMYQTRDGAVVPAGAWVREE